jgi:16S rRNA (guanine966-N2)-methyltransferase
VRETLFNWLQAVIPGARCLDLFAGSGALGLEALSRGAELAVLVEHHAKVAASLKQNVAWLGAAGARVLQVDALAYLRTPAQDERPAYDVVFLDPPFKRRDLLESCCVLLEDKGWLAPRAYVYLESDSQLGPPSLPPRWCVVRSQRAGQVAYRLALREQP